MKYREEQNRIGLYIKNNLEFIENENLEINDLDDNLKNWFETNYRTKMGLKYLLDILEEEYELKINKTTINGLKLKNNDMEIKNDKDIFIEEFKKSFKIIDKEEEIEKHYVKSVRFSEWARLKKLNIYTSKSINNILLNNFNYDCNNKTLYKYKKIDGKSILCWFGIKEL